MAYEEFPKMAYKAGETPRVVNSDEEFKALGKGWQEKPVDVPTEDQTKVVGLNTNPLPAADPRVKLPDPVDSTAKDGADPKFGTDAENGLQ